MMSIAAHLEIESMRATELLQSRVVSRIVRPRSTEVLVEFTDGSRLFVDRGNEQIELSISGGAASVQHLTIDQAYLAMFAFLENQFRSMGSDDIGGLLGSLSLLPDGSPADPAHRQEWASAVYAALNMKVDAKLGLL